MSKYAPPNITTGGVQTTSKTIPRITFSHDSVFDGIKKLAEFVDYIFYVDSNEVLQFKAKTGVPSGIIFDNTNIISADVSYDLDSVKNRIYVYGGRQLVATPTESFTSNGLGSIYTINYKPSNTAIKVNSISQKGDLFLSNTSIAQSGINYLVKYHDKQIVFVSGTTIGNSIPKSGSGISIDYQVQRQIIKVITNDNVLDSNQARDIAKNQLELKKNPLKEVNINVQGLIDISPGTTALVNISTEGIVNETLDVLQCGYDFNKENNLTERVLSVKLSQRITNITDVLKALLLKIKSLETQKFDSEGIMTRLLSFTGSMGIQVKDWSISKRYIGHSFILNHPVNGILGSPALAVDGQQIVLGWAGSDWSTTISGT